MNDCGESKSRQLISGIAHYYRLDDLINERIIVLTNLKPRKIMGLISQGMLTAADINDDLFLLKIDERKPIPPSYKIK